VGPRGMCPETITKRVRLRPLVIGQGWTYKAGKLAALSIPDTQGERGGVKKLLFPLC